MTRPSSGQAALRFSIFIVLLSYSITVFSSANYESYYSHLAAGFSEGHLYLPVEPRPELLTLADPYDPAQNEPYRLHDASLCKGKYYLYFGPTPALILYLPFRWITGQPLPDRLAVYFFAFGGFVWAALLLFHLREKYFRTVPEWMLRLTILVAGLANCSLYNFRRAATYEVAISCGVFFLTGAVYFFCRAIESNRIKPPMLALASLLLGLAVGARPQFVLSGVLLLPMAYRVRREENGGDGAMGLSAAFLPFLACLMLLAAYNHLRFGSPFDFGHKYQLAGLHLNRVHYGKPEFIAPGIYLFIFKWPTFSSSFPFVHPLPNLPQFLTPSLPYFREDMVGLLPGIPIVNLLYLCPLLYGLCRLKTSSQTESRAAANPVFPRWEFAFIAIPACLNLATFLLLPMVTLRYLTDYATLFILAASVVWFHFHEKIPPHSTCAQLLRAIAAASCVFSILLGYAFSYRMTFY